MSHFPTSDNCPLETFNTWFDEAKQAIRKDPNAMTLATASPSGTPMVRVVLLKDVSPEGFVFFTNYESQKSQQLQSNPVAELNFYWRELNYQVRIHGRAGKISSLKSDAYFAQRQRPSQIGAWASMQSQPLTAYAALEKRIEHFEALYEGKDVPRPPHWGGWCVQPDWIEFWHQLDYRLHQRCRYTKEANGRWAYSLLYP